MSPIQQFMFGMIIAIPAAIALGASLACYVRFNGQRWTIFGLYFFTWSTAAASALALGYNFFKEPITLSVTVLVILLIPTHVFVECFQLAFKDK